MKRFLSVLLLLCSPVALAHDTVDAGSAGVVWHIDTNELLQVGGPSTLSISLTVEGLPLPPERCRCTLLLYPGEVSPRVKPTVLKTTAQGMTIQSVVSAPAEGVYSLVVDGRPIKQTDFAPFRAVIYLTAAQDVHSDLYVAPQENKP